MIPTTAPTADDLKRWQSDPAEFRRGLLIDADTGPRPFAAALDDWQSDDFACPLIRRGDELPARRLSRRTYEHGFLGDAATPKQLIIAVSAAWVLFASQRSLSGVVCAADEDQAALTRNAIARLIRGNAWLGEFIECQKLKVINKHTGSTLEIISSDAPSSYGLLIDFAICDEANSLADTTALGFDLFRHCQTSVRAACS